MNEVKKNSFIYLGFFFFIIIALLISIINISRNFLPQRSDSKQLKELSSEVEKLVRQEFLNLPSRFTRFNYIDKEKYFKTPTDYRNFYQNFNAEGIILVNSSRHLLEKIDKEYNDSGELPVIYDNMAKGLYIPLSYVEAASPAGLREEFKNIFGKRIFTSDKAWSKTLVKNYLNYILIKTGDKKTLVMLSPPRDPDPLYTDNRRRFIVFSYENNNGYAFKNFELSNTD